MSYAAQGVIESLLVGHLTLILGKPERDQCAGGERVDQQGGPQGVRAGGSPAVSAATELKAALEQVCKG